MLYPPRQVRATEDRIMQLLVADRNNPSLYFSAGAFHTVPIREEDKHKTAFSTRRGHYHFNKMPVSNAQEK